MMKRSALVLAAILVSGTAACGEKPQADGETVTITVNALPPATEQVNRKQFEDDLAEFHRLNPKIKIEAHEGKMEPETFNSRLAGGQLEDVFYAYFTAPQGLIAKKQAADITPHIKDFPAIQQIKPNLRKIFENDKGNLFGVPFTNYSMGLLYNRALFTKAGLDPDKPPTTWAEVREAAKKIAALGDGTVGYGDYSKSNTGGWHFTAELYSIGGQIAKQDGEKWKADFNNDKGKQVLKTLHEMRWTDNSMGSRQQLEYADLLQLMGSGKLGMYLAAADNIPTIVNQYKGNFNDLGLGPMPGGQGTLAGGEAFMFNAKATPAKIKAGLKWLTFHYSNPDHLASDRKRNAEAKVPVGLPEPAIWTGEAEKKQQEADKQYANVPQRNYAAFASANIPHKLEPPNAQQIYAVLDTAMLKVLTDKNASIDALLADAEKKVQPILDAVK